MRHQSVVYLLSPLFVVVASSLGWCFCGSVSVAVTAGCKLERPLDGDDIEDVNCWPCNRGSLERLAVVAAAAGAPPPTLAGSAAACAAADGVEDEISSCRSFAPAASCCSFICCLNSSPAPAVVAAAVAAASGESRADVVEADRNRDRDEAGDELPLAELR